MTVFPRNFINYLIIASGEVDAAAIDSNRKIR